MILKCHECGYENEDGARFCRNCGKTLEKKNDNKKIIIISLIAVIIVLAGAVAYMSGILTPELEMERQDFEGFSLEVPADSRFVLADSITTQPDNVYVGYLNKGKHFYETGWFAVGMNVTEDTAGFDSQFIESDGDLKVYKNESEDLTAYKVFKEGDKANIIVYGTDLNSLKRMAQSFRDEDFSKLASTSSASTTQVSSGHWTSVGSYSGSGTGHESVSVPAGQIRVELSAYPIKNYATNHLYVTSSSGDSGGVDWGSTSAVETRSDSFTFTSSSSQTLSIDYYETVEWNVEIYRYQ